MLIQKKTFIYKNITRVCLLFACSFFLSSCFLEPPSYSEKLSFHKGEHSLGFVISKHCTYEIGVSFLDKKDGKIIKETFGPVTELNLPASMDIFLTGEGGQTIFSTVDFGGAEIGYRYGPNPTKFIAGKVYLHPGNYTAVLNVKTLETDFSDFKAEFFISGDPKVTCKKK